MISVLVGVAIVALVVFTFGSELVRLAWSKVRRWWSR